MNRAQETALSMATQSRTLLNLDTLDELPTVVIKGVPYALYPPDALPIAAMKRYMRLAPRLEQLWNLEDPTEDQDKEIAAVLDQLCRMVLEAPAEVHAGLTDVQRWMIYRAFLGLSSTQLQSAAAAASSAAAVPPARARRPRSKTGARSSRGSSGSTASTHGRGTKRSRAGSSGRT